MKSLIHSLDYKENENQIFMKREDLLPFSFGGNKVRVGLEYLKDAREKGADVMISYGSSSSNMSRAIAGICQKEGLSCYVVSSSEEDADSEITFNSQLVQSLEGQIVYCKKTEVATTIQNLLNTLIAAGKKPYYIYGDARGKGTEAVGVRAYEKVREEIFQYENEFGEFDYIFHGSGTGNTQAGLIYGNKKLGCKSKIIGISIARSKDQGTAHILELLESRQKEEISGSFLKEQDFKEEIFFEDGYLLGGYGTYPEAIKIIQKELFRKEGIPLDHTYTGKAFLGMKEYLREKGIKGAKILFIHTGGTPLFFDDIPYLK